MQNIKTPGVYIREVSKLPASVAPVSTAIPAFVGYTERAEMRGEDVRNSPVRITSMLEFNEVFGNPFNEQYGIVLPDVPDGDAFQITGSDSPYLLHYALQLFYANGGGPCYVVSVGLFEENPSAASIDLAELQAGLTELETEDEPTLLVIPEAVMLNAADRTRLHNDMLAQCDDLKDRFALFDALADSAGPVANANTFRDQVGMSHLSYGAAYYPALRTTLTRFYRDETVIITDNRGGAGSGNLHNFSLSRMPLGSENAVGKIVITNHNHLTSGDDRDVFTINGEAFTAGTDFEIGSGNASTAENLRSALAGNAALDAAATFGRVNNVIFITLRDAAADGSGFLLDYDNQTGSVGARLSNPSLRRIAPEKELYNAIKSGLSSRRVQLYPSSAMAGIYARVDRERGVWKAPANVSVAAVASPSVLVTDEQQESLNVDPNTGKSVNAIRRFSGKGTLVWGARTLAGNDNEWRYVPVRRFFIFMEQSIKKATEAVVFEPNDANTWSKTRGMIENFLTNLWRDGAIAGATPDDAFFVKVGLGETMTALDILEGRLIIEIGVAAVRPAEFIILRFMHKLQES